LAIAALLLISADCRLELLGPDGSSLEPMTHDAELDDADRHYPAHANLRSTKEWGSWWLDPAPIAPYIRRRPEWTFDLPALPEIDGGPPFD
jgi:hypothetical protein